MLSALKIGTGLNVENEIDNHTKKVFISKHKICQNCLIPQSDGNALTRAERRGSQYSSAVELTYLTQSQTRLQDEAYRSSMHSHRGYFL